LITAELEHILLIGDVQMGHRVKHIGITD